MSKALLSFCAIPVLTLALSACGEDKQTTQAPKTEQSQTTSTAAQTEKASTAQKAENKSKPVETAKTETTPAPTPVKTQTVAQLEPGDISRGEKAAKKCKTCHTFDQGGKNKVGPNLFAVVGRTPASVEGFNYSKGLQAYDTPWTEDTIATFIAHPNNFLKANTNASSTRSKMSYKVKKEQTQRDIAAFLATLK